MKSAVLFDFDDVAQEASTEDQELFQMFQGRDVLKGSLLAGNGQDLFIITKAEVKRQLLLWWARCLFLGAAGLAGIAVLLLVLVVLCTSTAVPFGIYTVVWFLTIAGLFLAGRTK